MSNRINSQYSTIIQFFDPPVNSQLSTVNYNSGATGIDITSNPIATCTGLPASKRGPPFLYDLGQINDRHEMSPVVKQTGKVFRPAVQFFQGESGNYFDCAPAISGFAIVLYIK